MHALIGFRTLSGKSSGNFGTEIFRKETSEQLEKISIFKLSLGFYVFTRSPRDKKQINRRLRTIWRVSLWMRTIL